MKNQTLNQFKSLSKQELSSINGGVIFGIDCVVAALALTVPAVIGGTIIISNNAKKAG